MSTENPEKFQNTLWWITSIAVSVVCCATLFVLFASYLVEMKASMQENEMRIEMLEGREKNILVEIQALRKQITPVAVTAPVAAAPLPTAAAPEGNAVMVPVTSAPAVAPEAAPTPSATGAAPAIAIPTLPTSPVKP